MEFCLGSALFRDMDGSLVQRTIFAFQSRFQGLSISEFDPLSLRRSPVVVVMMVLRVLRVLSGSRGSRGSL